MKLSIEDDLAVKPCKLDVYSVLFLDEKNQKSRFDEFLNAK